MDSINFNWFMIGLDSLMIIYTLWVISLQKHHKLHAGIALALFVWLGLLSLGLSSQSLFPADISGIAFLSIIFLAVGVVGALLLLVPAVRTIVLALTQTQLLLL